MEGAAVGVGTQLSGPPGGDEGSEQEQVAEWPGERSEDQWYEYLYTRYVRAVPRPRSPPAAAERQYRASERLQLLAVHTHDQYRHPHRPQPLPGCALGVRCPGGWRGCSLCACTLWPCTCGGALQPPAPPASVPKGPKRGAAGSSAGFLRGLMAAAAEGCECALRPTGHPVCTADRLGFICDKGLHSDYETRRLTRIMMDANARELGLFTERFEFQLDTETGARSVSSQTFMEVDDETVWVGAGKELWGKARPPLPPSAAPGKSTVPFKKEPQEARPLLVQTQMLHQTPAVRGEGGVQGTGRKGLKDVKNTRKLSKNVRTPTTGGRGADRRSRVAAYWSTGCDIMSLESSDSIDSCHCDVAPAAAAVEEQKEGVHAPLPPALQGPLTADGTPPLPPPGASPPQYCGARYVPLPAPREPGLLLHDTRGVRFSVHELPAYPRPKKQTWLRRALQFARWDGAVSASRLQRWLTGQPTPPRTPLWTPLPPDVLRTAQHDNK